jgi:hypothetical protein
MDSRTYVTTDGIALYLDSLRGFHQLMQERSQAGRRREIMPPFCVLRRYLLLPNGDTAQLTGMAAEAEGAPPVVPLADLEMAGKGCHGDDWRLTYRLPASIAPIDEVCPECGHDWNLENCHDAVLVHVALQAPKRGATPVYMPFTFHAACHRRRVEAESLRWAVDFLDVVGLNQVEPEMVEGMIGGDPTPWFRINTPVGPIHFGRMPVGFGIEWRETGKDLPKLFQGAHRQGHPIEHGPMHVLPPDETFLCNHFQRLREALGF